MKTFKYSLSFLLSSLFLQGLLFAQAAQEDYLLRINPKDTDPSGYVNSAGDTMIPPGKYPVCFTDTFRNFAVVLDPETGFIAIDRAERILYEVFPYDNGPDYISDGLFRIVKDNKIGYADQDGRIIIPPKFDCAFPFENGIAKVSMHCTKVKEGEHISWKSAEWIYIDKAGHILKY